MAYPDDKETFRRVVNQELPDIPGDVLDTNDQNLPADFLERLQDTLGYNLKMGFANVKAFFDDIVSKFAAIKKIEIITLHQGPINLTKNSGEWVEYGADMNLIATDIVLFQTNFIWRSTTFDETYIGMTLVRISTWFGENLELGSIQERKFLTSTYNYVLTNPTPGDVKYKIRITQNFNPGYWKYLSFNAIKISI